MLTFYENIVTDLGCVIDSVSSPIKWRLALYLPCLSYGSAIGTKDECMWEGEAAAIIIFIALVTVRTLQ